MGLLGLAACSGVRGMGIETGGGRSRRTSGPPQPPPEPFDPREEIPVRLAAVEGREELVVLEAGERPRTFLRAGDLVVCSDGRAEREISLAPRSAVAGLHLEGRIYPGRLVVSARPAGGLRVVNFADLEHYVEGVVAAELVLWSAHFCELQAQAVAVRTYALATLSARRAERARASLWDSVEDQAYRGRFQPGTSATSKTVARRLRDAVESTRALVLTRGGRLEDARFHAACGGHTAALIEVFEGARAGPPGTVCPPCDERAQRERAAGSPDPTRPLGWKHTFAATDLAAGAHALAIGTRILSLEPRRVDGGGRWLTARVVGEQGEREVFLDELRAALDPSTFKSSRVLSTWPRPGLPISSGLEVRGLGRGHGVGLCQEGCHDLAREGWPMREILGLYYRGARVERLVV